MRVSRRTFCKTVFATMLTTAAGGGLLKFEQARRKPLRPILPIVYPSTTIVNPVQIPAIFNSYWNSKIHEEIAKAMDTIDKDGFVLHAGDSWFIWRPQNGDCVSEGMGYWMKILANASQVENTSQKMAHQYQNYFNHLLNGVLNNLNANGLMSWRLEYEKTTDANGHTIIHIKPISETDKHSATDADLYIAQALIHADQMEQAGIWQAHPQRKGHYAKLASEMLAHIKGHDIVAKHERHILTVSDSWGHKDILKEAITINPSYIALSALSDFANFDKTDSNYWLAVRRDNFEVLKASIEFSETLYAQLQQQKITVQKDGKTWYMLDWLNRELIINLLERNGKELTEFGVDALSLSATKRIEKDDQKRKNNAPVLVQSLRGKLLIEEDTFKQILAIIDAKEGEHPVPFVPDQVEAIIEANGKIRIRIEIGEGNLSHVERYDGIRGYRELGLSIIANNDSANGMIPSNLKITAETTTLLTRLIQGKEPEKIRVGRDLNLVPLACYLIGAVGVKTPENFIKEFNTYIDTQGIFDPFQGKPRYYNASLAFLTITDLLKTYASQQKEPTTFSPYPKKIKAAEHLEKTTEEPPKATGFTGYGIFDSPLTYLSELVANDYIYQKLTGQKSAAHYPVTARKMYQDAHRQIEYYPTNPEVRYNAAASSRNVGLYRQAAKEFFHTLILLRGKKFSSHKKIVVGVINNIESLLSTLNYGKTVIADIFQSFIESNPDLDIGIKLTLQASIIKLQNQGGNHVKVIQMAIRFMQDYPKIAHSSSPFRRVWEKIIEVAENSATPRKAMLTDVITSLMESITELARVETKTLSYVDRTQASPQTKTKSFQMVVFEGQAALQIPKIIFENANPQNVTGDIKTALDLVQSLRTEIPLSHKARFIATAASINQRLIAYRTLEITRLRDQGLAKLDTETGLLTPLIIEMQPMAIQAEKDLYTALEQELAGEKNVFVLAKILSALVGFYMDRSKIHKALKERERLEPGWAEKNSRVPNDFTSSERQYNERSDLDFRRAIYIGKQTLMAFEKLSLSTYAGISSTSKKELLELASSLGIKPQQLKDIENLYQAASIIAEANPSADPRTVLYAIQKIELAGVYSLWSEVPPATPINIKGLKGQLTILERIELQTIVQRIARELLITPKAVETAPFETLFKQAFEVEKQSLAFTKETRQPLTSLINRPIYKERITRLYTALKTCEEIPNISISNQEHWLDLSIQSVMKSVMILHQIRKLEQREAGIIGAQKAPASASFKKTTALFKARLGAMLEGKLPNDIDSPHILAQDPIVRIFLNEENRSILEKVFHKFPERLANAWASYGNVTWWGENNIGIFNEAIRKLRVALQYDNQNIEAISGLLQVYLQPLMKTDTPTLYHLYKKGLNALSSGGINPIIQDSVIGLASKLPDDNIGKDLRNIAASSYSREEKIRRMREVLLNY